MPIIHFLCEKCKRKFDSMAEAENCENSHLTIQNAYIKRYGIHPHPYEIEVVFNNGDSIIYIAEYLRG